MFCCFKGRSSAQRRADFARAKSSKGLWREQKHKLPDDGWQGIMEIEVLEGKMLKPSDPFVHSSDPFVTLQYDGDTRRTRTVSRDLNPQWGQMSRFHVKEGQREFRVQVNAWDRDFQSANDLIGHAELTPSKLPREGESDIWVELQDKKIHDQNKGESAGFVHLKFRFRTPEEIEEEFWYAFVALVDSDNNGYITAEELKYLTSACGRDDLDDARIAAMLKKASQGRSEVECKCEELAELFWESQGLEDKFLAINPITQAPLPADPKEAMCELFTVIDREASQFMEAGWVSPQMASRGWFLGLTEWILPGSFNPHKKASGLNPLHVKDRHTGLVNMEYIPSAVSLALRVMYQKRVAMVLFDDETLLTKLSQRVGQKYAAPSSVKEIPKFIDLYGVNMDESLHSVEEFASFNDFFTRELKPGIRPIAEPNDEAVAVSAADCRLMVWHDWSAAKRTWIKGKLFSLERLLADHHADEFTGASLAVFRLAPQDYHRVHFPVSGTVQSIVDIPGKLYTVNPIAVREEAVNVFTDNKRMLLFLKSPHFGLVCMVIVGATAVGSIHLYVKEGDEVKKGDLCSHFAYGGSTVICVFQRNMIDFDGDLQNNSSTDVETYIRMGDRLGGQFVKRKSMMVPADGVPSVHRSPDAQ